MNLKLADYGINKEKFERFLELGEDFGYFGDYVILAMSRDAFFFPPVKYRRDKKDPLNRFNGLFDGRTYGDGRFVLVIDDCDNIHSVETFDNYGVRYKEFLSEESYSKLNFSSNMYENDKPEGNLHENPELYEKIK